MSTSKPILVVDDDPKIRRLLRATLESEGMPVVEAADSRSARAELRRGNVGLVTLDLGLGGEDGLDLARELRRDFDIPLVMVTGRGDVIDRVVGLEIGADDYIVKPFHPRELLARVKTVMRRAEPRSAHRDEYHPAHDGVVYSFDGMTADTGRMQLTDRDGGRVDLTSGDFRLLTVFLDAPQRVLSRDAIMDRLNGATWSPLDRTIDNQVARLRKKIERNASDPELIKTVRGIGYTFSAEVQRK